MHLDLMSEKIDFSPSESNIDNVINFLGSKRWNPPWTELFILDILFVTIWKLHNLTMKSIPFIWFKNYQNAFHIVQDAILNKYSFKSLKDMNFYLQFVLHQTLLVEISLCKKTINFVPVEFFFLSSLLLSLTYIHVFMRVCMPILCIT